MGALDEGRLSDYSFLPNDPEVTMSDGPSSIVRRWYLSL
jgi:hypothetical protein